MKDNITILNAYVFIAKDIEKKDSEELANQIIKIIEGYYGLRKSIKKRA